MDQLKSPVYTTLNMRLKLGPADRDMALLSLACAMVFGLTCESVLGALTLFSFLLSIAILIGSKDPQWLNNWTSATIQKNYYDPAK